MQCFCAALPPHTPLTRLPVRFPQPCFCPQVVDDAHATLVCGERGGGAAEMQGVAGEVDLHVGTLR